MAASIAEFLYPASQHQAAGEPYKVFVTRVRALYHKQVLVPLRRCLDVPEVCLAYAWTLSHEGYADTIRQHHQYLVAHCTVASMICAVAGCVYMQFCRT